MRRRWRRTRDALDCSGVIGARVTRILRGLARASGIEAPSREDLVRLHRKRKKRRSNKQWKSPADKDARRRADCEDEGWAHACRRLKLPVRDYLAVVSPRGLPISRSSTSQILLPLRRSPSIHRLN
jgi:hypothetical protein